MFQQFKNIDTAFKFVRAFAIVFILCTTVIVLFVIQRYTAASLKAQDRIFVLSNGKLLQADGTERHDSLAVEVRDHIKMFHFYFYTLQPNTDANSRHLNAAFNLSDSTAYSEYRNLQERGYYAQIISGSISQEVLDPDSIKVDISQKPYHFRYYGRLRMSRPTSILTRSIVTEGYIRDMGLTGISDQNPHGLLLEHFKVIDNRDISFEKL